ncbi:glutathione S-transferase family protein [Bradyrhizobium sp. USDA 4502]
MPLSPNAKTVKDGKQLEGGRMSDLIVHHYDFSNYSEKIRVALGVKSLEWGSVAIPPVLPKPNLVPLTGGYRRAPVLQIGADVYCDTRLILRELERRHNEPTFFPRGRVGLANAVAAWAEGPLFQSVRLYAWGTNHDLMPRELFEDRARMRGLPIPSVASVEQAAARNAPLVRAQLPLVEEMLCNGRPWLCGEQFSVADLAVYHALWFLTDRSERLAHELDRFESIRSWMSRVRSVGHGRPHPMTAESALEVARRSQPAPARASFRQPEDPELGSIVEIRAVDYAKDSIVGKLTLLDEDEIVVSIENDLVGIVAAHFPRIGFEMRAARSSQQ